VSTPQVMTPCFAAGQALEEGKRSDMCLKQSLPVPGGDSQISSPIML
jgi:hypothetical protein